MEKLIMTQAQKEQLNAGFAAAFGGAPERYFSAPGRTELSGNHTDHQRGRVLAGAVDLDMLAAVRVTGTTQIRILSQGYPLTLVDLDSSGYHAHRSIKVYDFETKDTFTLPESRHTTGTVFWSKKDGRQEQSKKTFHQSK